MRHVRDSDSYRQQWNSRLLVSLEHQRNHLDDQHEHVRDLFGNGNRFEGMHRIGRGNVYSKFGPQCLGAKCRKMRKRTPRNSYRKRVGGHGISVLFVEHQRNHLHDQHEHGRRLLGHSDRHERLHGLRLRHAHCRSESDCYRTWRRAMQ